MPKGYLKPLPDFSGSLFPISSTQYRLPENNHAAFSDGLHPPDNKAMNKIFLLLLAGLAIPAAAQNPTAAEHQLAEECRQLMQDTNTLADGTLCYRDNPEVADYFNTLSMVWLFNHPKADQCRRQALFPATERPENNELPRLCTESRAERARLRRQVEAWIDSRIPVYAREEARQRSLSAEELLRQTRAEEAERRTKIDAYLKQMETR